MSNAMISLVVLNIILQRYRAKEEICRKVVPEHNIALHRLTGKQKGKQLCSPFKVLLALNRYHCTNIGMYVYLYVRVAER